MSDTLDAEAWEGLARLSGQLQQLPVDDIDRYQAVMMKEVNALLGADSSMMFVLVAEPGSALQTSAQRTSPVIGSTWRPYAMFFSNMDEKVREASEAYSSSERAGVDEGSMFIASQAGTDRVYLSADYREMMKGKSHEMTEVRGAVDRLIGVHAFSDSIEVCMVFDRLEGGSEFTPRERELLKVILPTLKTFTYRLSLSLGLIVEEGMEALTPRERETMLLLLGSKTEKEMAAEMGLTHRSMHQYVTRVYRKLNVGSRSELTWLWLRGGEPEA